MDPQKITITSTTGDNSGVTFKISGTLADGTVTTKDLVGGAAGKQVVSSDKWEIITGIKVTVKDTDGKVKVGLSGDGSKWAKTQIKVGTKDARQASSP